jgi:hypothetical protein
MADKLAAESREQMTERSGELRAKSKEYQCGRCGSSISFHDCPNCGGEGYTSHDCGEDCCCCAEPEDNVPCDVCNGDGTFARCLSSPEWCEAHPMAGRETTERSTVESFSI